MTSPIVYSCAECHAPVIVIKTLIIKKCDHTHAGVVANLSAICYGQGNCK